MKDGLPIDGLPLDAYGHEVTMDTDGTKDYYLVGGAVTYSFPAGTPQDAVYLSIAIQQNLAQFNAARLDYILNKYSRDMQIQLLIMYEAAVRAGLTNRSNYIGQLMTWVNGIVVYTATYVASIQALTDPAVVSQTVWDFSQFPTDPEVTMLAAVQIPN